MLKALSINLWVMQKARKGYGEKSNENTNVYNNNIVL